MNRMLANRAASLIMLAVVLSAASAATEVTGPIVAVASGALRGEALPDGGAAFKGIPFAAPPVGVLRWKQPAPVTAWMGIRDATEFSRACMQPDQHWNSGPAANDSEDCLYLNIWTPTLKKGAHRPVMIWLHGGGFAGGAGGEPMFSGEHFAARGIVLVSLNYRLGVFGFLAHPELSAESATRSSGNYGLLDQLAALRWVQTHISRFGGDAENITLFGQSAGGGSVLDLLTSPLARHIAKQAIVESGAAAGLLTTPALQAAEQTGTRFAGGAAVRELRALSAAEILQRYGAFVQQGPQNQMAPIVDGVVLPVDPHTVFAHGQEQHIPLIIGNNAREGFGRMSDEDLRQRIPQIYGSHAQAALQEYALDREVAPAADPVFGSVGALWLTDTSFRCGALSIALRHSATGSPVYEYQFEQSLPGREAEGAAHSYELPYVFGNLLHDGVLGGDFLPADHQLSDLMLRYWTDFAKRGNPNATGVPEWPRFDATTRSYVRLATRFEGSRAVDAGLRRTACQLYEQALSH
jgi:para-nitrobenzyl esterase